MAPSFRIGRAHCPPHLFKNYKQSSLKPSFELTGPYIRRPTMVNGKSGIIRRRRSLFCAEKAKAAPPISHVTLDNRYWPNLFRYCASDPTTSLRSPPRLRNSLSLFICRTCAIPKEKGLATRDYVGHGWTRPQPTSSHSEAG